MPTYDYRCDACGHQLSAQQGMTEPRLRDCPICHEPALARLIGPAGFALKGGGWYQTDFKGGAQAAPASESKGTGDAPACGAGACPACE